MRVFILGLLLPLLAAGCIYDVPATPSTAAAGAVAGKPRIETPVSYALTPELAALKSDVDHVYVCSTHAYPINAAGPLPSRLRPSTLPPSLSLVDVLTMICNSASSSVVSLGSI